MQVLEDFALRIIRFALGVMLLVSVVLICANAFGRYVLAAPIIWAEEVLGFALVWLVYLGAVQVTRDDGHLRMDLVLRSLPATLGTLFRLIGQVVFLATAGLVIYQSRLTISEFGHQSQIASLPMDVLHSVIPVSFALMFVLVLIRGLRNLRPGDGKPGDAVVRR